MPNEQENEEKFKTLQAEAHKAVDRAVVMGEIIRPARCSNCAGMGKIDAHHHDYNKPLSVAWLCAPCHALIHNVMNGANGNRRKGHAHARTKAALSRRELEVAKLICAGMQNRDIAAKLEVSKRTIETHRERIHRFAGVRNAAQLVAWCLAKKHVSPEELIALVPK